MSLLTVISVDLPDKMRSIRWWWNLVSDVCLSENGDIDSSDGGAYDTSIGTCVANVVRTVEATFFGELVSNDDNHVIDD